MQHLGLFRLNWPPDLVGLYNKPQVLIKFWDGSKSVFSSFEWPYNIEMSVHNNELIWVVEFSPELTSLKFQKFTWPLACVYISFVKLKNICSWFFSVLFKNLKDISMILHDFSCFIQDLQCFIYMYLKNIHVSLHSKKYIQDFSRFFMFIQDLEWH